MEPCSVLTEKYDIFVERPVLPKQAPISQGHKPSFDWTLYCGTLNILLPKGKPVK